MNNIYDIFDKLHPNMTQDELLQVCFDLRYLKLKDNPNIIDKFDGDASKQFQIINFKYSNYNEPETASAAFNSINDIIHINETYIDKTIKEDRPFEFIISISHELEHYAQKYENNKEMQDIYASTTANNSITDYNIVQYLFMRDYEKLNAVINHLVNSKNDSQNALFVIDSYKQLLSASELKLYINNKTEFGAFLMSNVIIVKNFEFYIKKHTNSSRRKWLNEQNDKLQKIYNAWLEVIKKGKFSLDNESKLTAINNLIIGLLMFTRVNTKTFILPGDKTLNYCKTFLKDYCKLCYISKIIDKDFKHKFEGFLDEVYKTKEYVNFLLQLRHDGLLNKDKDYDDNRQVGLINNNLKELANLRKSINKFMDENLVVKDLENDDIDFDEFNLPKF